MIRKDDLKNYEGCLVPAAMSYDNNSSYLSKVPYRRFSDMALTLRYMNRNMRGVESIPVTDEMLSGWGITYEQAMEYAKDNYMREFKVYFDSLSDVIERLAPDMAFSEDEKPPAFILTNDDMFYGGTIIFMTGILDRIRKSIGCDFYIIPSSVNELIVIPESVIVPDDMEEIIHTVNRTMVSPSDILSDFLYIYKNGKLETVKTG